MILLAQNVANVAYPTINPKITSLPTFATELLGWFLGFMGALAVLAVVYSGFMYITAGADSDQAEKAKKNLTWAITGVIIVALSSTIVYWVNLVLH